MKCFISLLCLLVITASSIVPVFAQQALNVDFLDNESSGYSLNVFVEHNIAYVGISGGVKIYDVERPRNIGYLGEYQIPPAVLVSGVYAQDGYAYLAANGSGFIIVDVSIPNESEEVGRVTTITPNNVFVDGNYAYLTTNSGEWSTWYIYDISYPDTPNLVFSGDFNLYYDVTVVDDLVYLVMGGLEIWDISEFPQNSPELLGTSYPNSGYYTRASINGDYAHCVSENGDYDIIDISNPEQPVLVAELQLDDSYDVFVEGQYAYVTRGADSGVFVYDISNLPSTPQEVGYYIEANENTRSVFAHENIIYITQQPSGFTMLRNNLIPLEVSGAVTYANNASYPAVPNVDMALFSQLPPSLRETATDETGDYLFTELPAGDAYNLGGSKDSFTFEENQGGIIISTYDAARVAQYVNGIISFDDGQVIAADVSNSNGITIYDASLIAQFAAKIPNSSLTGEWKICAEILGGVCDISIDYDPLDTHMREENFEGILMGEITGNWTSTGGIPEAILSKSTIDATLTDKPHSRVYPNFSGVILSISEIMSAEIIAVQFIIESEDPIYPQLSPTVPRDWELVYNQLDDTRWFVGAYGVTPITEPETIIFGGLRSQDHFRVLSGMVNETMVKIIEEGILSIPQVTALLDNYPNPFNPQTTIRYQLAEPSKVNLFIYNLKGNLIRQIVSDEYQTPDIYSYVWNGKDQRGTDVGSGIYLYQLEVDSQRYTKQMMLLK